MSGLKTDANLSSTNPADWLDQHGDYLFGYAMKQVRNTDLAEDLVQETLLAGITAHARFAGQSSIRTWLVGILKHKILDHRRRNKSAHAVSRPPVRASDAEVENWVEEQFTKRGKWKVPPEKWGRGPLAIPDSDEFRAVLSRCLDKLPSKASEAMLLIERQGMNTERLSNVLNISATNVGVLLYRARSALRRCLEVHWFGRKRDGDTDVV